MKSIFFHALVIALAAARLSTAAEKPTYHERFKSARAEEKKGNASAAFLQYLTIPGAEYAAANIGRTAPDKYLALLATATNAPTPTVQLIKGDLLLNKGETNAALACYRTVAASFATDYETGWAENRVPWNYYYVELEDKATYLLNPFRKGIGSHHDNWLIRRFTALEAIDDAEKEFERIWALHLHDTRPHVEMSMRLDLDSKTWSGTVLYLTTNSPPDANALCFAADYASFLQHHGKEAQSLNLLLPPLLTINLDKDPYTSWGLTKELTEQEAKEHPPKAREKLPRYYGSKIDPRAEYIHLNYTAFLQADKHDKLINALERAIENGHNAARLTLAQIRLHQQDAEGSLELELAYIREGGFNAPSATYRRGHAYDNHQKLDQAAAEFEALLAMKPSGRADLPYVHPKPTGQRAVPAPIWERNQSHWTSHIIKVVIPRLQRIYIAQGESDKQLALSLKRFDLAPAIRADFKLVEATAKQHAAADQKAAFETWALQRVQQETNQAHRANLFWVLDDPENTLAAIKTRCSQLSRQPPDENAHSWRRPPLQTLIREWKPRFQKHSPEHYPELLKTALTYDSADSITRLQLLDTFPDPLGPDAIQILEQLLAPGTKSAFPRGKGAYNRTRFRGYLDLALRLIRLYEKEKRIDDLLALGEQVARGEKPFPNPGNLDRNRYGSEETARDLLDTLSLLLHYADIQTLERLAAAWSELPDFPAKRQLARKQRGGFVTSSAPPIPWANLPEGIEALASSENVLSLTADDHYVYSGHPWGIAVYDHEGHPVVRVALGAAALCIETHAGKTWVGTPLGLWRIELEKWEVVHLPMNQDIPERDRKEDSADFHSGTLGLAADGDFLWIGTRRDIRRLDLKNGILRIFSQRELGVNSHNDWKRILVEENYIWFNGYDASLRFDRTTESWAKLEFKKKTVHLIGDVEGELFGHVNLGEPLRNRPCLINRETLEITPVLIQGNLTRDQRCINGPFSYFGTYHDKPVFGPKRPSYTYDRETGKLTPIGYPWDRKDDPIESPIPSGLRSGIPKLSSDGSWSCYDDVTHRHTVFGKPFPTGNWEYLTLTNGVRVLGGSHADSPRYIYLHEDRPNSSYRTQQRAIHSGGLYFISTNDSPRRVSSSPAANAIPSDLVYTVTTGAGNKRRWLCGDSGISLLTSDHEVLENIQRADGLPASRVTQAIIRGGETHFTLSDGRQTILSPASHIFRPSPSTHAQTKTKTSAKREPLLGGYVVATTNVGGARFVCGTRGLLIIKKPLPAQITLDELAFKVHVNATKQLVAEVRINDSERLIAEAKAMKVAFDMSLDRFKALLTHANPFVRATALERVAYNKTVPLSPEFPALVIPHLTSTEPSVRRAATFALTRYADDTEVIPQLKPLLSNPDKHLRGYATVELCHRGVSPPLKNVREILEQDSFASLRFQIKTPPASGSSSARKLLIRAIAPLATPEVFALALETYPLSFSYANGHSWTKELYPNLGQSLRRHPEAAEVLLSAYGATRSGRRRDFSMHVFQSAGTNMLATLHTALGSDDRIVRSNAARACGAIGDPSSIQPLIAAWELPSGLSRASIAWALGELRAGEAAPLLERAYFQTIQEEKRRRGPGQNLFSSGTPYSTPHPKTYGAERDERRNNEEHITSRGVLSAMEKIDPAATESFYQTLAADENYQARENAAERLVHAPDREKNIAILRPLLADEYRNVQQTAAASLLILGDAHAESYFLEWLAPENPRAHTNALRELQRIESPSALAFARPALERIAASTPGKYDDKYNPEQAKELLKRIDP